MQRIHGIRQESALHLGMFQVRGVLVGRDIYKPAVSSRWPGRSTHRIAVEVFVHQLIAVQALDSFDSRVFQGRYDESTLITALVRHIPKSSSSKVPRPSTLGPLSPKWFPVAAPELRCQGPLAKGPRG